MTAGRLRPAPWPVLPCLAALLAVGPVGSAPAFEARLERGLEYHTLSSLLSSTRSLGADTLRLSLGFEGRRGFRDWNRESSRLSQATHLGWERPAGPWSWLVEGHSRVFAETFQGDRDRRRTVQGDLAAGIAWNTGTGTVRALAGLGGDARRESTDSGALLRLAADTEGTLGTVDWQGLGQGSAENLDTRRNRGATLDFRLNTDPGAPSRDEAGLSLAYQREDLYLDPSSRQLERRVESRMDLSNSLISRPLAWSETRLDTRIWRLDQSRLPLALPGSVTPSLSQPTRDSRHEDLGFEASLGQRAWLGPLEGELATS